MDPNETLRKVRLLVSKGLQDELTSDEELELIEYVDSLDSWMSKGGSMPDAWKENR